MFSSASPTLCLPRLPLVLFLPRRYFNRHGTGFLLRGCGKRCGIKNENSGSQLHWTPIAGINSIPTEGPKKDDPTKLSLGIRLMKPPTFAVSSESTRPVVVAPHASAKLGPVFFKPHSPGDFSKEIYIRNNVTLVEPVSLRGHAAYREVSFYALSDSAGRQHLSEILGMPALLFNFDAGGSSTAVQRKVLVIHNAGELPIAVKNM
jgi:hypothetical protein